MLRRPTRSIVTSDTAQRIKRRLQSGIGLILRVSTFLVISVVGGFASSWYVVNNGATFTVERNGPWVKWTRAAQIDGDPYSRIRHDRNNMLVFNSRYVSRYEAQFDDQSRRLHSSCHYVIEGVPPASVWWNLIVFDSNGRLIPNPANRHGFNVATVVPNSDGSMRIDLARDARPGNWIPTSRAGRLVVVLELQNETGDSVGPEDDEPVRLPTIKRIDCS